MEFVCHFENTIVKRLGFSQSATFVFQIGWNCPVSCSWDMKTLSGARLGPTKEQWQTWGRKAPSLAGLPPGMRAVTLTPLPSMYSTRPCCLVQSITRHTCPNPHLGAWNCLPHSIHIALSGSMSSTYQQSSNLGWWHIN